MSEPVETKSKYLLYAFIGIGFAIYTFARSIPVDNGQLFERTVQLAADPVYNQYETEFTKYYRIILPAANFEKSYYITSFTYKALNHPLFRNNIKSGDKITIYCLPNESDKSELNPIKPNCNQRITT